MVYLCGKEQLHEYQVVGRPNPTEAFPNPKIYRMRLFAPNKVVAKSRFWYFIRLSVSSLKKSTGEILGCNEIFEKKPTKLKNFSIWIRYDSRSGTHNMTKEFRDTTRCGAVEQMYREMSGRHRARWGSVRVLKVTEIPSSKLKRPAMVQFRKLEAWRRRKTVKHDVGMQKKLFDNKENEDPQSPCEKRKAVYTENQESVMRMDSTCEKKRHIEEVDVRSSQRPLEKMQAETSNRPLEDAQISEKAEIDELREQLHHVTSLLEHERRVARENAAREEQVELLQSRVNSLQRKLVQTESELETQRKAANEAKHFMKSIREQLLCEDVTGGHHSSTGNNVSCSTSPSAPAAQSRATEAVSVGTQTMQWDRQQEYDILVFSHELQLQEMAQMRKRYTTELQRVYQQLREAKQQRAASGDEWQENMAVSVDQLNTRMMQGLSTSILKIKSLRKELDEERQENERLRSLEQKCCDLETENEMLLSKVATLQFGSNMEPEEDDGSDNESRLSHVSSRRNRKKRR